MAEYKKLKNKTDEELILLTLANKEYFLHIIKRYEDKLFRYIKTISNVTREDAEDLLQEVFIKAYKNIYDFSPKYKFSSWIYRIAHNETISRYRRENARPKNVNCNDTEIFLLFWLAKYL